MQGELQLGDALGERLRLDELGGTSRTCSGRLLLRECERRSETGLELRDRLPLRVELIPDLGRPSFGLGLAVGRSLGGGALLPKSMFTIKALLVSSRRG